MRKIEDFGAERILVIDESALSRVFLERFFGAEVRRSVSGHLF